MRKSPQSTQLSISTTTYFIDLIQMKAQSRKWNSLWHYGKHFKCVQTLWTEPLLWLTSAGYSTLVLLCWCCYLHWTFSHFTWLTGCFFCGLRTGKEGTRTFWTQLWTLALNNTNTWMLTCSLWLHHDRHIRFIFAHLMFRLFCLQTFDFRPFLFKGTV